MIVFLVEAFVIIRLAKMQTELTTANQIIKNLGERKQLDDKFIQSCQTCSDALNECVPALNHYRGI